MKKGFTIAAVAAVCVLAFTGCSGGSATTSSMVDELADPWAECASLTEAEEKAGFQIEVPAGIGADAEKETYRYCEALKGIEIQYTANGASSYVRKARDDGDISGDYDDYAAEKTAVSGGLSVTLKGAAEDEYTLATWNAGNFAYCIGLAEGVSEPEMLELAAGLR